MTACRIAAPLRTWLMRKLFAWLMLVAVEYVSKMPLHLQFAQYYDDFVELCCVL
jgi:hypothetical protein